MVFVPANPSLEVIAERAAELSDFAGKLSREPISSHGSWFASYLARMFEPEHRCRPALGAIEEPNAQLELEGGRLCE